MTEDRSLCVYETYYKLAQQDNSYTKWYTIHFLSLNALVLISLPHVFFFSPPYLEAPSLFHLPSSKFPFGHLFSQTLGEDGRRSYFAMNSTL